MKYTDRLYNPKLAFKVMKNYSWIEFSRKKIFLTKLVLTRDKIQRFTSKGYILKIGCVHSSMPTSPWYFVNQTQNESHANTIYSTFMMLPPHDLRG